MSKSYNNFNQFLMSDCTEQKNASKWETGDKLIGECKCDSSKIIEFVLEEIFTRHDENQLLFKGIQDRVFQYLYINDILNEGLEHACNRYLSYPEYHNWRRVSKECMSSFGKIGDNLITNARFEHRYDARNYDYNGEYDCDNNTLTHIITKKKPPKPKITVETRHQRIGFPGDIRSWYAVQFRVKTLRESKDRSFTVFGVCNVFIGEYTTSYDLCRDSVDILRLSSAGIYNAWSTAVLMPLYAFEKLEEIRQRIEEELNK